MLARRTTLLVLCSAARASALAVGARAAVDARPRAALSDAALAELRARDYVSVPNFLEPELVASLVSDIELLREAPGAGRFASAHRGSVEWFELLPTPPAVPAAGAGRGALLEIVAGLQRQLEAHADVTLHAEHTELKYAFYPTGGFYQRHVDAMNVGRIAREWSFLLYLNVGWRQSDGGHLRIFEPGSGVRGSGTLLADFTSGHSPLLSSAGHVDVAPQAGSGP